MGSSQGGVGRVSLASGGAAQLAKSLCSPKLTCKPQKNQPPQSLVKNPRLGPFFLSLPRSISKESGTRNRWSPVWRNSPRLARRQKRLDGPATRASSYSRKLETLAGSRPVYFQQLREPVKLTRDWKMPPRLQPYYQLLYTEAMADRFDVDTEKQQRCIVGYWRTNKNGDRGGRKSESEVREKLRN